MAGRGQEREEEIRGLPGGGVPLVRLPGQFDVEATGVPAGRERGDDRGEVDVAGAQGQVLVAAGEHVVDVAVDLGASCVSLWSGVVRDSAPFDTIWERLVTGLGRVLDHASARG
ncbi:MAG: hypothetical protein ACKOTB_11105, partial [Planctomycetia bacterium]